MGDDEALGPAAVIGVGGQPLLGQLEAAQGAVVVHRIPPGRARGPSPANAAGARTVPLAGTGPTAI
ncbi:hypothetical protein GCM10007886_24840 [Methylobacterium gregans]|nr:hypothetical protein GCM10007886_24840 [Methylobacterium gregans]